MPEVPYTSTEFIDLMVNAHASFEKTVSAAESVEQNASNAQNSEQSAGDSERSAKGWATSAKSWAIGGTNSREGEDADNSQYWAAQAYQFTKEAKSYSASAEKAAASLSAATPAQAGITKLYDELGDNADGTMTQKAITEAINNALYNVGALSVFGIQTLADSTGDAATKMYQFIGGMTWDEWVQSEYNIGKYSTNKSLIYRSVPPDNGRAIVTVDGGAEQESVVKATDLVLRGKIYIEVDASV